MNLSITGGATPYTVNLQPSDVKDAVALKTALKTQAPAVAATDEAVTQILKLFSGVDVSKAADYTLPLTALTSTKPDIAKTFDLAPPKLPTPPQPSKSFAPPPMDKGIELDMLALTATPKELAPLSSAEQRAFTTLTDASLAATLQEKYPAATANRRQMALAVGGDDILLQRTCDTRMVQTLGDCRDVVGDDRGGKYATVADLLVSSGAMNHQSKLLAMTSPTGKHLLRPNASNDGLELATAKGWTPVTDEWVTAQRFDDTCEVAYANTNDPWNATMHPPSPSTGKPFYYERGGGDTCAITAINNFSGSRVAVPSQYKSWAEVEFAKDGRKLPKSDPEHYAKDQIPASPGADGVGPADLKGFAAHLGLGDLTLENRKRDGMADYLDTQASTKDRFIIGRPANTHFYALRKNDADGRWYLLDNRAPAQVSYASPGAWIRSLMVGEDLYVLHR